MTYGDGLETTYGNSIRAENFHQRLEQGAQWGDEVTKLAPG